MATALLNHPICGSSADLVRVAPLGNAGGTVLRILSGRGFRKAFCSEGQGRTFLNRRATAQPKAVAGPQDAISADSQNPCEPHVALQRRGLLLGLSSAALLPALPALADAGGELYQDASEGFSIAVPPGWASGGGLLPGGGGFTGPSGARRTLAWFPPEDLSVNVSLVITNVGADYTTLGSFGDAETFGTNLVSSMDRSFTQRGPFKKPGVEVQTAQLLGAKSRNSMYMLEYVVKKPQEEQRHLLSVVSMGFNGVYNRLYTVTAQCFEPDLPKYRATLESVVQSFKPPVKA